MRAAGRVEIAYEDEGVAERMLASVRTDDGEYVRSWREGRVLVAEAKAASPGALRQTFEDLLACLAAAEGTEAVAEDDPD